MKNRKSKIWIFSIFATLLITNSQLFKNLTGLNDWYYLYSNISGNITVMENPRKGRIFRKPKSGILPICKNVNKANELPHSDTIIHRLFYINPLKFWRWGEYIFNWRYRLPYTDWEVIEKRRGFGYLKISKGCMEF